MARDDFPQPTATFAIGCDHTADIVLADDSVDHVHAEIAIFADGKMYVADLGSRYGTFRVAHGKISRVAHHEIFINDVLRFGTVEMALSELLGSVANKHPGVMPAMPRRKRRFLPPRSLLLVVFAVVGCAAWSYMEEQSRLDGVESSVELAKQRIAGGPRDSLSRDALDALLQSTSDQCISAACLWQCSRKNSLTDEIMQLRSALAAAP